MKERETIRSRRFSALMAFGAVSFGYLFVWCLTLTVAGELPDYSFGRLLAMGVITAGALFLAVVCALSLRRRAVIGKGGIDIVRTSKREHLTWSEITEVSTGFNGRFWDVEVRIRDKKRVLLLVPVSIIHSHNPRERYDHAPPHAPRRLREQYGFLRETWENHHKGSPTTDSP